MYFRRVNSNRPPCAGRERCSLVACAFLAAQICIIPCDSTAAARVSDVKPRPIELQSSAQNSEQLAAQVEPAFEPQIEEPPDPSAETPCKKLPKPCTVVSDTSNTTALKEAVQHTPLTGGTIVLLPGTYTVDRKGFIFLTNRDWLYIVGVVGANGELPVIRGKEPTEGEAFDGVTTLINWTPTNGNLILKNIELTGAASDCLASGSGKRKQIIQLHNVHIHHCGHHIWMHGWEPAGSWDDEVYAEDSSFHHAGLTHNLYIDRIAKATFVRIKSFSPRLLHAFKCVAIECNLISSHVSNASLDGTWDTDNSHWTHPKRQTGYLGTAPLSLVACQRGQIRDNRIVFRYGPSERTGGYVATRQPRHDIFGCDQPPYGSDQFQSPDFWRAVRNDSIELSSIAQSPHFMVMRWSDNEVLVRREEDQGPVHMLLNNGTVPLKANEPGSTRLVYIDRPDEWLERSIDLLANNCFEGFRGEDELFLSRPWGAIVDPPEQDPNPGKRILEIGGNECGKQFEVPGWF